MKGYLIESPAGLFLVEKTGKIAEKALFPRNPQDAAQTLELVKSGKLPEELSSFSDRISKMEIEQVTVDGDFLASIARSLGSFLVNIDEKDETVAKLRNRLPSMLVRLRLIESKDDYDRLVREVSLELAKKAITKATTRRDLYAIQTVRCIEDLDKTLNLLAGRMREWYGLHFPELDRLVEKHDTYMRLIQNLGNRESFSTENLIKLGIPQDRADSVATAAEDSAGATMQDPDMEWLREVSGSVLELQKLRETAEKHTEKVMTEVAPNMSSVAGPVLAAKLISTAGGLENLARMPASTLQVLGAEKALFRTLKTGARPPKHGIIFQYSHIHQSPKWLRGRIARALAGKLAIAARMDAYGGENRGDQLREALDAKIKDLKSRSQTERPKRKNEEYQRRPSREGERRLLDRHQRRGKEAGHFKPGPRHDRIRGNYSTG